MTKDVTKNEKTMADEPRSGSAATPQSGAATASLDGAVARPGWRQKKKPTKKEAQAAEIEKIMTEAGLSQEKAEYYVRKQRVLDREEKNYTKIIFFRSNGNWWKICGNSVLYFDKLVRGRIPGTFNLMIDSDSGSKSKDGIINIKNIELTIESIKDKLGMKESKLSDKEKENRREILLGRKVTIEELKGLRQESKQQRAAIEKMITPDTTMNELKREVMELVRRTREVVKRLDASLQRQLGDPLMQAATDMVIKICYSASGRISELEALSGIIEAVERYDAYLLVALNIQCFKDEELRDLGTLFLQVKRKASRDLARVMKQYKKEKTAVERLKEMAEKEEEEEKAEKAEAES